MTASPQVVVAGAGVFGLATALVLAERGCRVAVLDPGLGRDSASAVAAGLLAPTSEALFDPAAAPHHALFEAAMALWPAFAEDHRLQLAWDGSVVPTDGAAALHALGARTEPHPSGLLITGEARVADPTVSLETLCAALVRLGGRLEPRTLQPSDIAEAEAVVLAAGPGLSVLAHLAPEVRHLEPVKGQIAVLPHGPSTGPTLRWPGGYLAPQASGARAGATMELGRTDTRVEPKVIARLAAEAQAHCPGLDIRDAYGQAGVRMQTPDGLPLAGPSRAPRIHLAGGARRNGWLLAPLVGVVVAAYCMGEEPGPWAAMLDPRRFDGG